MKFKPMVILLAIALLLAGCGRAEEAVPTEAPTETPTEVPTSAPETEPEGSGCASSALASVFVLSACIAAVALKKKD